MKTHNTQKLFWKRWPYKVIIEIVNQKHLYGPGSWAYRTNPILRAERTAEFNNIITWCQVNLSDVGFRKESHLSLFLNSQEELQKVLDHWGERVLATWIPESDSVKDQLLTYGHDVIRKKPWYGRFPIRARICFTDEFRLTGIEVLRSALSNIDENDWIAKGLLFDSIKNAKPTKSYGWGQPTHLYIASQEDAMMLRLQCGAYIERFEKIRTPD